MQFDEQEKEFKEKEKQFEKKLEEKEKQFEKKLEENEQLSMVLFYRKADFWKLMNKTK